VGKGSKGKGGKGNGTGTGKAVAVRAPSPAAVRSGNEIARLAGLYVDAVGYAYRAVRRSVIQGLLLGDQVNADKRAKVVPHGEWEDHVVKHSRGLSPGHISRLAKLARLYSSAAARKRIADGDLTIEDLEVEQREIKLIAAVNADPALEPEPSSGSSTRSTSSTAPSGPTPGAAENPSDSNGAGARRGAPITSPAAGQPVGKSDPEASADARRRLYEATDPDAGLSGAATTSATSRPGPGPLDGVPARPIGDGMMLYGDAADDAPIVGVVWGKDPSTKADITEAVFTTTAIADRWAKAFNEATDSLDSPWRVRELTPAERAEIRLKPVATTTAAPKAATKPVKQPRQSTSERLKSRPPLPNAKILDMIRRFLESPDDLTDEQLVEWARVTTILTTRLLQAKKKEREHG